MTLWEFVPVADPRDPRWLDHVRWETVIVRAAGSGLARSLAADMERRHAAAAAPAGNESLSFASGLDDEKLYAVRALGDDENPGIERDGPDEVVWTVSAAAS